MKTAYTIQAKDNNSIAISLDGNHIYLDIRDNNVDYLDGWDLYLSPAAARKMAKILKGLAKGLDSDESY